MVAITHLKSKKKTCLRTGLASNIKVSDVTKRFIDKQKRREAVELTIPKAYIEITSFYLLAGNLLLKLTLTSF